MKNDIKNRKARADLLELFIVLALIFMITTIYVPKAIWEEELMAETESRFNMQNLYDVESFYKSLTDSFIVDVEWAIKVVNTVRDSLHADSTYFGEKEFMFEGLVLNVNIPKGFDVDFDTTFGFAKTRRDTIIDTTHMIVMFMEKIDRNDTLYVQNNKLAEYEQDENFVSLIESESNERSERVDYYDSYQPDMNMLNCPLTGEPYRITVSDSKESVRIASPITDIYKERRYLIFALEAASHGYINDGTRSWD